jgi:PAS domain S-box-containing protein
MQINKRDKKRARAGRIHVFIYFACILYGHIMRYLITPTKPVLMSEGKFDILFYSGTQPMWVFDVDTLRIIEVNSAAIKRYGFTKKEFLSKTIMDLRMPEDIPLVIKVLPDIRGTKTRYREFKHVAKNGRILNVEIMSYPFMYKDLNARLVVAQNIDEKKEILGRLDFTEHKLEQILEETKIGFFQLDYQSRIIYWNQASEKLIGYKREYVKGRNLWDVFPELKGSDFYHHYEWALQKLEGVQFTEYFWPVQRWFSIDIYPVADGIIVTINDVTSKQRMEERLLEKIEQMSEVSFLNSHYIRKPVASLLGLTTLFNEGLLAPDEIADTLQLIRDCALELDEIVKRINTKANDTSELGDTEYEMGDFSLNGLLNEVAAKLPEQVSHKLILKKKTDFIYYGNRKSIATAVASLVKNAIKFSPKANRVVIDRQIIDNNLVLSVRDFGEGIDQNLINKIFLSFSKRSVARELGTGFQKITEAASKHNGSIWVESIPGKGTTFSMRFPLSNISNVKVKGKHASVFKNPGIEIDYDKAAGCIIANWRGFHSLHSVKTGCIQLLEALIAYNCSKILNNNTNVLGTWDNAVEWVVSEWFPLAQAAGLKYIGWVYSPSTFSRLSADLTIKRSTGNITHKTFNKVEEASDWLKTIR